MSTKGRKGDGPEDSRGPIPEVLRLLGRSVSQDKPQPPGFLWSTTPVVEKGVGLWGAAPVPAPGISLFRPMVVKSKNFNFGVYTEVYGGVLPKKHVPWVQNVKNKI